MKVKDIVNTLQADKGEIFLISKNRKSIKIKNFRESKSEDLKDLENQEIERIFLCTNYAPQQDGVDYIQVNVYLKDYEIL